MLSYSLNAHFRGLAILCLLLTSLQAMAREQPNTEVVFLSGTDNTHTVPWEFFCTSGRKSGYWTTIETPSCWEQQGFGHYDYGRDYRTFGKNFRFSTEIGKYRHTFTPSTYWKGKAIYLVFEGVMTDAEVSINGVAAGPIHQGGFYAFRFEISHLLEFGKPNFLEVTVHKMSANQSVNQAERYADYWVFGGIFRPVYLEVTPKSHIQQSAIQATANGIFHVDAFLDGVGSGQMLSVELFDPSGKSVGYQERAIPPSTTQASLEHRIPQPKCWNAETPYLYTALLRLHRGKTVQHQVREVFGFRTIEVRSGDGVYINGTKIKFKGVNRHCFWPETGRTLSREIDRMDVELMKAMNLNAVRCAHYPPDRSFLQWCDSLGLYVLDELAGWQNAYDTQTGAKLVREMVLRDRNHPSIIFWSNGNEGGTNKALDDDFVQHDPSGRPVIHAHHRPGNYFNGIETNHYEKYYSVLNILSDSLIYMPTEFLHAQDDGGGGAALQDFWELMWASPRSAGGFIWALLDEGIVRTDLNGAIDVNRVNAPDGILGPHREREGSFYAIRDIFAPIVLPLQPPIHIPFNGKLEVQNRYHFTNLNQCSFQVELLRFPKPWTRKQGHEIIDTFSIAGPDVAPGQKGVLTLPLLPGMQEAEVLQIHALDPNGHIIRTWSWKFIPSGKIVQQIFSELTPDTMGVVSTEDDSIITLSAQDVRVAIQKHNGQLKGVEYSRGLNPIFHGGPIPVIGQAECTGIRLYRTETIHGVEATFRGALDTVRWEMSPQGWLSLEYTYTMPDSFPVAGVSFSCPESNIMGVRWLGNGPYRVWKNRLQGGTYSVWESVYNNTATGSTPWQYPEFKGYFSNITWMELRTADGNILVGTPEDGLFVRLFNFHALSGPIPHPALPPGDLSFLDAIPPTGTKLATGLDTTTWELGPQSSWNKASGSLHRKLYFYFGLPFPFTN